MSELVSICAIINFQLKWRCGCGPEKLVLTALLHILKPTMTESHKHSTSRNHYQCSYQWYRLLTDKKLWLCQSPQESVRLSITSRVYHLLHTVKCHIKKWKWLLGYYSNKGSNREMKFDFSKTHISRLQRTAQKGFLNLPWLSPPKVSLQTHNPQMQFLGGRFSFSVQFLNSTPPPRIPP